MNLLYLPTLQCNLHCSYCNVRKFSAQQLLSELSGIKNDLEMLAFLKTKGFDLNILLHGGEVLLVPIKELTMVLEKIRTLQKNPHIGMQTNLTLLKDAHLTLIKEYGISISTSVDFPKQLHNDNRCGSYDLVLQQIKKLQIAGGTVSALSGVHNETMNHLNIVLDELTQFKEDYSGCHIRFTLIYGDEFTLTVGNQIKFANFLIENNLVEHLFSKVGIEGCKTFLRTCQNLPVCDWISLHNGIFDNCAEMGYKFDPTIQIAPRKKTATSECMNCSVYDICQGGCTGHKETLQISKSPFCEFNKIILSHIKQLYGIKTVTHHYSGEVANDICALTV